MKYLLLISIGLASCLSCSTDSRGPVFVREDLDQRLHEYIESYPMYDSLLKRELVINLGYVISDVDTCIKLHAARYLGTPYGQNRAFVGSFMFRNHRVFISGDTLVELNSWLLDESKLLSENLEEFGYPNEEAWNYTPSIWTFELVKDSLVVIEKSYPKRTM